MRLLWIVLVSLLAMLAITPAARAQTGSPRMSAAIEPREIQVGDVFVFTLNAMSDAPGANPTNPRLKVPPGIVIRSGPHTGAQSQVSITGSGIQQFIGVAVTWQLQAQREGTYSIGPASVQWGRSRVEVQPIRVVVRPRGSIRRPSRAHDPFDLFDLFGFGQMPMPGMRRPGADLDLGLPTPEPELAMTQPRDDAVFLEARVDRNRVVLGEQVTLTIYQYFETQSLKALAAREPPAPEFLQKPLLAPDDEPPIRHADVGGSIWRVRAIRKLALFPLRTGKLEIGPMEMRMLVSGRRQLVRQSQPIIIDVRDAPPAGQPVGFQAGNVGNFDVKASVQPRTIQQGGAVGVEITVRGSGNVPTNLPTPTQSDVEWLEPEVREQTELNGDQLETTRVFKYVVRVNKAGAVDLGELRLPFYDPSARRYRVASAPLGVVTVEPAARPQQDSKQDAPPDRFAAIGGLRASLQPYPAPSKPMTDHLGFWIALAAGPCAVVVISAGARAASRAKRRVSTWQSSLDRLSMQAIREARKAQAAGDTKTAASCAERALHAAIESSTGLKSRGLLRSELQQELAGRGLDAGAIDKLVALLNQTETIRFDPAMDQAAVRTLIDDIDETIRRIPRTKRAA